MPENATVIIARDGDLPGSKAEGQLARAASQLAQRGMTVLIATPPEEQDFNDVLVREGEAAVRDRIEAAERFSADEVDSERKRLFIGSNVEMSRRVREDLGTASPASRCGWMAWRRRRPDPNLCAGRPP